MFLFFILSIVFAQEYDNCEQPQIITQSTNVYLDELSSRKILNEKKKGIWIEIDAVEKTESFVISSMEEVTSTLIEVANCTTMNPITHDLPWYVIVEKGQKRTFFLAVDKSHTTDVTFIVDRMKVSTDKNKPVIIREETFPLKMYTHGYVDGGKVYYQIIGRTNWKVDVYLDEQVYYKTYDVKEDETMTIEIELTRSVHWIYFDYSKTELPEFQHIDLDDRQPLVLNAIFRPNAHSQESNCYDDYHVIVGYKGSAKGFISVETIQDNLKHYKFLEQNKQCVKIEDGSQYSVDGDFYFLVVSDIFNSKDINVMFSLKYSTTDKPDEPDQPSTGSVDDSEEGLEESTLIAIIVVSCVVGVLIIIAIILLIFILYKKFNKKGDYQILA